MIFDKNSKGAEELQKLTGNYYANNNFSKIETEIQLESEKIILLIGQAVYDRAETHYQGATYKLTQAPDEETEEQLALRLLNDQLVQHIQLPVALLATHHFYQANIVSHEDSGRKVKIDANNEKQAWEWQIDRDDQANLRKAYNTIDRLIRFLDLKNIDEWKSSAARKATKALFVPNTEAFQEVYPIDHSPRFYYTVLPFIKEVQRLAIKPALGAEKYDELLEYVQREVEANDTNEELEALLDQVKFAMPLLTMVLAVKRLSIQVLPEGVVQQFKSQSQTANSSKVPLTDIIKIVVRELQRDAAVALDKIKELLITEVPDYEKYPLIPENPCTNQIFRT